jgi:hypothetical protein
MKTPLFLLTQVGFAAVTFVFYGLAFRELKRGLDASSLSPERKKNLFRRSLLGFLGWMIVVSGLSMAGFFEDFSTVPPKMALVFVVPFVTILIVTFSKTLPLILAHIPAQHIIRLQSFRILVEVLLWMMLVQNLLPVQMTFEGRNWDILAGVTAPLFAYLFANLGRSRAALILWNIAGLLLLLNVVVIAILSFPTPFRVFLNEPSNAIVARFPFIWLPGFLVPLAYTLHFFSLRQLTNRSVVPATK